MNSIQQQSKQKIEEFHAKLKNDFGVSNITQKAYNYELSVDDGTNTIKVLVYFGKKGVKTIIQGNPGSSLYNMVESIISDEIIMDFGENPDEPDSYIGTDESGKGDIFGPLIIAGFYTNKEINKELSRMGVADSKTLSQTKINTIFRKLHRDYKNNFEVEILQPELYNKEYSKFGNLNKLMEYYHTIIISRLYSRFSSQEAIVDKFQKKAMNLLDVSSNKYLNKDDKTNIISMSGKINIRETEKAERFLGVAAASIIARGFLNTWFEHMRFPKGASLEAALFLKDWVYENGTEDLDKYGKLHFKTFNEYR